MAEPYTTLEAVQSAAGGEARLRDLSDFENRGYVNDAEVAEAIKDASAWIDSYVQRRLPTPLDPVPETIETLAARETVYQLMVRRQRVSEFFEKVHEANERWLDALSRGIVSIGAEPERTSSSAITPKIADRDATEPVSRSALKGFV